MGARELAVILCMKGWGGSSEGQCHQYRPVLLVAWERRVNPVKMLKSAVDGKLGVLLM